MVFTFPKCTSCMCGVVVLIEFRRFLKYFLHLPRMFFSLLSKKPFWSLMDLAVWDLLPRRRGIVCQKTLLASNWNPVYVWKSPMIAFWTFSPRWVLQTFAPQRIANAKISRLCSETMPCRLLSSNSIFHFLVPPSVYFFSRSRRAVWSYSLFEQPPFHLRFRCAFRGFSELTLSFKVLLTSILVFCLLRFCYLQS